MAQGRYEYIIGFNADTSKLSTALQQLQTQLNNIATATSFNSSLDVSVAKLKEARGAAIELTSVLSKSVNTNTGLLDLSKFSQTLKAGNYDLASFGKRLQQIGPEGSRAFLSLSKAIAQSEAPLIRSNALMEKLWTTMQNTVRWQITAGLLTGFTSGISDAYRYAQDLNESLNNIRIVTGKSSDEMAKFAIQANKAAKELNTTTTKYTDASLIYYQQGLSDQEVKARTDVTTKFANVSRENLTTSSEYLTAIWNNFAKGSKNLEYFADVVVALGAATASSSQEIATGLNKFAATAETVGLSYEYATSALATVTATTRQSADVVGTAFKTLFSRIQDLELGKTLDDGTTLGKYSKALDAVGVSIKDSNGELRDMDDILDDTGDKWQTLSKDQQVALAQAVGGVRQYTQFIALMDNWDFMKENLETAKNATGELQKQADIFAESWEAARKNVKASAEGITQSLIDEDFWIDATNGFADFLKVLDSVVKGLNGLKGILSILGVLAFKLYGNKMSNGIRTLAYNIDVLRGKEEQHLAAMRKTAAETTKTLMQDSGMTSQNVLGSFIRDAAFNQEELNIKFHQMTDSQKQAVSHQMELVKLTKELAMAQGEAAIQAENEARSNAKTLADTRTKLKTRRDKWTLFKDTSSPKLYEETMAQFSNKAVLDSFRKEMFETLQTSNSIPKDLINRMINAFPSWQKDYGIDPTKEMSSADAYRLFGVKARNAKGQVYSDPSKAWAIYDNPGATGYSNVSVVGRALQVDLTNRKNAIIERFGKAVADQDIPKLTREGQNLSKVLIEGSQAQAAFEEQIRRTNEAALKASGIRDYADNITAVSSALMNLSMAWSGFQSLGQAFTEEDLSLADRFSSIIFGLSMALPGLAGTISSLQQLGPIANKISTMGTAIQGNNFTGLLSGFANSQYIKGLENAKKAGKTIDDTTKATIANAAASNTAKLAMLGWAAAIAALIGIIALVAESIETEAEKTEAINQQYENLKSNYESVKSSVDELKSSLDALGESQDALNGLTEGTEEWRDAVKGVNSEVLELIRQYPALAKYVTNKNGLLTVSDSNRDKFLKEQQQEVAKTERSMNVAAIAKNNQDLKNLKNEATVELSKEFKTNRSSTYGNALNKAETLKLIQAIQESGSWILSSKNELANLGFTTDAQVKSIQENSDKILELSDKMQANIEATSLLVSTLVNDSIDEDLPPEITDALAQLYVNNEDIYKNDFYNADKAGLAQQYKEANNSVLDAEAATFKNGINVTYDNGDGTTRTEFVSSGAANEYIQANTSVEDFAEKYGQIAENLYNQFGTELTTALLQYASGNLDVNTLDAETYNKLKDTFGNKLVDILNQLGLDGAQFIQDHQLDEWNETQHNRIKYLGSGLGGALNTRDTLIGKYQEAVNSEEYQSAQGKLEIGAELDVDEQAMLDNVNSLVDSLSKNADEIKLQINSSLREDVDEAFDIAKNFDTLQDKIANGLEMTTDEVIDLIDSGYGALLQNCEATSEGLISLNQDVVDAYVAQKKEEVEVDKQAKIAQLKTQRELLVVQKEALEKKLQLLDAAANAEDAQTAARYLAEAMMQQAIADDAAEQAAAVVGTDVEKSKALTDDAKAVADYVNDTLDATTNTAIDSNLGIAQSTYQLSQDVISYWNNMAEARANYFKINENNTVSNPVSATAGAPNVGNYGTHQNTEDVEIFDSSKLSDPQAVEDQIKKWTEGILERAKNNVDAIKDAAGAMMGDSRKELDLVLSQIGSIDAAIARINGSMLDSVVGGKDKNGSSSSKDAKDTTEALKEVLERYHEITREIEYQKDLLDDISNMADRAYGTDKVELLTQKIDKLNKVAELQKEKQAAAAAYVLSDLEAIRAAGMSVSYDTASYELKNYTDLLNQITDEYNSMINSVSDENRDAVQKEYDDKMKLLENYEDSIDTFRDELNEYQDTMREIEDTKLERIEAVIQIKLDWKQFQDTLRQFAQEVNESIGDALDQALQATTLNKQGAQDELAMFDAYEAKMNALLDAVRNANEYTDVASLQKELASLREELADSASTLLEYVATLKNVLPDALEAASERFNEFISVLENGQQTLEAINTLANLQSINYSMADKYALLGKSYNAVLENAFTQAKLQKQYTDRAAKELEEAEAALAAATQGTAEYDILKANRDALLNEFNTAQSAMLSTTQQAMQAAQSIYSNALDEIFYEFEQKMSKGMGYDLIQSKYNRTKEEDDRFLDGVNRFVETQTLNNKLQQSINAATNDYAKSTLKALEEEFAQRQSNADLSEYDLKIMEAKYNMTLKQIALEEAQNAKSKVRLVRGANGNYNYLFTADNNDINQKQQEYLKAMQDYYNTAKQQTENITGEIVSLWKDMSNEIRKIYENDSLDADQRQSAVNEIQNYYQKKYEDLIKMQKDAAQDMNDAGNNALDEEQKIANQYGNETNEIAQLFKENFKRILEEMGGDAENFNSDYSDTLLNLVALEGSFSEMTEALFSKLNDALNKYKGNISNISNEIGVSYDDLTRQIDKTAASSENLQEKATLAIEEIWNRIDEIQDVSQAQAEWTNEIYKTITAMQKLAAETATAVQKYNEAISNIQSLAATGSYTRDWANSATNNLNNSSNSNNTSNKGNNTTSSNNTTKTRVREQLGQFAYDSQIYKSLTQNGAVYEGGGWWNFYPENRSRLKTIISTTKNYNKGKSFATGGYTGEWDNGDTEGRVAMLHQKELVLNKTDTENMLAAVQAIRDFSPELIASIRSKLSAASFASKSLMGSRLVGNSPDFNKEPTELVQSVNINADFPGVQDAIEIKEALESLVQTASQRANLYIK